MSINESKIALIDDIPSGPSNDREFINKIFHVVFSDQYINKMIAKGNNREKILSILRGSKRYATIKGTLLFFKI